MMSLLFNKKDFVILSLVIIFVFTNYATAGTDLLFRSVNVITPWSINLVNPGQEIKFGCSILNYGSVTSDSYTVSFFIGNYFIGSITCDPLISGRTINISETEPFLVPLNIPDGSYTVKAMISCPNETVTNNNSGYPTEKLRVAKPYQDISINNVWISSTEFKQGGKILISTLLENLGTYTAENIYLEYYIGNNLIGETYRHDLNPEQEAGVSIEYEIPNDFQEGYYNIDVIATCTDDVDLRNNYGSTGSVWIGTLPDLEVKSVQVTNGTFMPKEMLTIYSLVKNIGDKVSNAYTADFYLSVDKNITAMDYIIGRVNRNSLAPGEQHSYNTTFKLPPNIPAANYYVGIKVTCNEDNEFGNNSGYVNETISIIHPANYVCGKVKYEFTGQNSQPVRYAYLKILDSGPKRLIAETYTDENGNYGEVVLRDEASSNIYIQVYTESVSGAYPGTIGNICSVKDDVYHLVFSQKSSSFSHPQNLSRNIDLTIPISGRAFMVFDSMVEAFIQAKEFFGIEMEPITTCWPSPDNGTYYNPTEGIFISIDDEWDRDIILHEYGHYIAEVYDFAQGDVGENPTHYWDKDLRYNPVNRSAKHAANLAFRESWPTLFSIASQYYRSSYPRSGDTKYQDYYSYYNWTYELDLENDTFKNLYPGEYHENMNCCSLWDIFDNNPDRADYNETLSDPNLLKIWSVLRAYIPEDMNDFWIGWYHRYGQNDDTEEATDIFQKHRMTFAEAGTAPVLPQNHAPAAVAGQDIVIPKNCTEGALVHLDASGSNDTDGDELSYIWRRGYVQYSGVLLDIVLPVGKNELELEVSDGKITSWDTVIVTVTPAN